MNRVAFDNLVAERLNSIHPDTPSDRCAWCDRAETRSNILLPIGVGARHAWLHDDCWALWREGLRKAAIEALAAMGIVEPSKDEALGERGSRHDRRTLRGRQLRR